MESQGGAGLKIAPGARNLMIFGPIACFRRSGSRFSGQNRPRSSEMRVYIKKYRAYKKSSKFQNFILVPGIQKTDFYDFSGILLRKDGPGIWEFRVRGPVVEASSETPCGGSLE